MKNKRATTQLPMPYKKEGNEPEMYDIYPSFKLEDGQISIDINLLARRLSTKKVVVIDGYIGVDFELLRHKLENAFASLGIKSGWMNVEDSLKTEAETDQLIAQFMGPEDSIFGTRATITLEDYFDPSRLKANYPDPQADINIIYGPGAQLSGWKGLLVYVDLPKNELQFRARAKSIHNLGASQPFDMTVMYKRYYFVDWVVLNRHKKQLVNDIDLVVDGQHEDIFAWMEGETLRKGLQSMAKNFFRARPWFEPGIWGGNWIKERMEGLSKEAQNYAWSFELITPENGIVLESSKMLLEVSFDFLMYAEGDALMGKDRQKFGDDFPIRFDFLDTFDGGNLSVQCHPRPEYCKEHFGENLTQEETYYILDRKNDASVYLGFQENIDPVRFEKALWESFNTNTQIDITEFVQIHPAKKHELFLIPPGTIHGSGIDNLVLEISTTPYIFTFKLYDWVRPDLNGKPRPINIEHGMKNLYFDRKGEKVKEELISHPYLLKQGNDWKLYELPTHEEHTYMVQRYHFHSEIKIETENKFHVLSLVEGTSITIQSENGNKDIFQYAETFVVPAAAKSYVISNNSKEEAILVVAFMK